MDVPLILRNLAWAFSTLLETILLFFLVRRKLFRTQTAFFIYILAVILQGLLAAFANLHWGTHSMQAWVVYWVAQIAVICGRWFAVMGIARGVLSTYTGIWSLASRILFLLAVSVLIYSFAFSQYHWTLMVLNADRAVELCIATFIVGMFVFVRYYRVPMANLERMLAIGFCLYSCSWVINDSIYEKWPKSAWDLFYYVNAFAFLASLLLWIGAVRRPVEAWTTETREPLSPEMYGELSQQLNSRLHMLNHRLDHLFHSADSRS